ncbi:MAG: cobalt ABC transporter ATP-binding protein [Planctomycetaceae bacterium]|nr:cobalt ABC transporter ATP-binding protein [Planctomycetaceae bacterium]
MNNDASVDSQGRPGPADSQPFVRVRGLSYVYPSGQSALDNVSFEIGTHEIVGLVGPSGAGKSTLLLHLNGLLPPNPARNGKPASVHVGEWDVVKQNLADVRQLVGLLFQDPEDQLFCPTVLEDVAFGPLNLDLPDVEVRTRVAHALAAVGMSESASRSTSQLSVGERKRVCLAGVLACHPALLALDEPFSNLDPRSRNQLLEILKSCRRAQIVATHDLNMVLELCDRVLLLDEGKIEADGPTETVLSNAALMENHGLEVPWRLREG